THPDEIAYFVGFQVDLMQQSNSILKKVQDGKYRLDPFVDHFANPAHSQSSATTPSSTNKIETLTSLAAAVSAKNNSTSNTAATSLRNSSSTGYSHGHGRNGITKGVVGVSDDDFDGTLPMLLSPRLDLSPHSSPSSDFILDQDLNLNFGDMNMNIPHPRSLERLVVQTAFAPPDPTQNARLNRQQQQQQLGSGGNNGNQYSQQGFPNHQDSAYFRGSLDDKARDGSSSGLSGRSGANNADSVGTILDSIISEQQRHAQNIAIYQRSMSANQNNNNSGGNLTGFSGLSGNSFTTMGGGAASLQLASANSGSSSSSSSMGSSSLQHQQMAVEQHQQRQQQQQQQQSQQQQAFYQEQQLQQARQQQHHQQQQLMAFSSSLSTNSANSAGAFNNMNQSASTPTSATTASATTNTFESLDSLTASNILLSELSNALNMNNMTMSASDDLFAGMDLDNLNLTNTENLAGDNSRSLSHGVNSRNGATTTTATVDNGSGSGSGPTDILLGRQPEIFITNQRASSPVEMLPFTPFTPDSPIMEVEVSEEGDDEGDVDEDDDDDGVEVLPSVITGGVHAGKRVDEIDADDEEYLQEEEEDEAEDLEDDDNDDDFEMTGKGSSSKRKRGSVRGSHSGGKITTTSAKSPRGNKGRVGKRPAQVTSGPSQRRRHSASSDPLFVAPSRVVKPRGHASFPSTVSSAHAHHFASKLASNDIPPASAPNVTTTSGGSSAVRFVTLPTNRHLVEIRPPVDVVVSSNLQSTDTSTQYHTSTTSTTPNHNNHAHQTASNQHHHISTRASSNSNARNTNVANDDSDDLPPRSAYPLIEHTPDFIHIISSRGIILYASPTASVSLLRRHAGELIGRNIDRFIHPGDLISLMRELKDCEVGGRLSVILRYRKGRVGTDQEDVDSDDDGDHNDDRDINNGGGKDVDAVGKGKARSGNGGGEGSGDGIAKSGWNSDNDGGRYVWMWIEGHKYEMMNRKRTKCFVLTGRWVDVADVRLGDLAGIGLTNVSSPSNSSLSPPPSSSGQLQATTITVRPPTVELWGKMSPQGLFLHVSESSMTVLGLSAEQLFGTSLLDLVPAGLEREALRNKLAIVARDTELNPFEVEVELEGRSTNTGSLQRVRGGAGGHHQNHRHGDGKSQAQQLRRVRCIVGVYPASSHRHSPFAHHPPNHCFVRIASYEVQSQSQSQAQQIPSTSVTGGDAPDTWIYGNVALDKPSSLQFEINRLRMANKKLLEEMDAVVGEVQADDGVESPPESAKRRRVSFDVNAESGHGVEGSSVGQSGSKKTGK
ncbi:blue light receptor, partial [Blyttiomyces sp. JEL0837]